MFKARAIFSLVLASAIVCTTPIHAGSSRAPALLRVHHGKIVAGNTTPLKDSLGDPVVVYYWDMTCIPCIAHLDAVVDFARVVGRTGGRFFSIHHGMAQTADTLQRFAEKQNFPYTIARGGSGPSTVRALPRMFVFNQQGDVVYQGPIGKLAVDAYMAQLGN